MRATILGHAGWVWSVQWRGGGGAVRQEEGWERIFMEEGWERNFNNRTIVHDIVSDGAKKGSHLQW